MSKVIKQMEMDDLKRTFQSVRDLVVLHIDKLSCQADHTLRSSLRKKNIRLKMVKNSLTRKVFQDLNIAVPDDSPIWAKSTVLAYGGENIKELSKNLDAELRGPKTAALYRDKVVVKGAIADGQPVTFEQALRMPTRLEVIGQIVGCLIGPASQIAGCLLGPASQVASQIKQIGEKTEEAAGAPAP
jgi:large subunit ribosomal protein L10